MARWNFRSYAKLNLHLQVVGRRPDGFHELRTVFLMIDLHDRVSLEILDRGPIEVEVIGADLPADRTNLAWRAAEAFCARWAPELGVRIRLGKRIPLGGGLGGGSSNAAAVLLGLRRAIGEPKWTEDLWPIARSLGADVPYFLFGGAALGFGRGDELAPLPEPSPEPLWLALPAVSVSTGPVFARLGNLTETPLAPSIGALLRAPMSRRTDLGLLCGWNDLQGPVFRLHPEIAEVASILETAGASWVSLTGSGSSVVARFADSQVADRAGELLPAACRWMKVRPVARSSWQRQWKVREKG